MQPPVNILKSDVLGASAAVVLPIQQPRRKARSAVAHQNMQPFLLQKNSYLYDAGRLRLCDPVL